MSAITPSDFRVLTPERAWDLRTRLVANLKAPVNAGQAPPEQTVRALTNAAVMLWRNDIWEAAMSRCERLAGSCLPPDVAGFGPQWWFAREHRMELEEPAILENFGLPEGAIYVGSYVTPVTGPTGAEWEGGLAYYVPPGSGTVPAGVAYGTVELARFPPISVREPLPNGLCPFAAGLCFLAMEWVGYERHRHSRQVERLAARKNKPLPEILTITLRRTAHDDRHSSENSAPREYSCSWLVSGHWRRQWYPSVAEWRPKYISPYLKGDTDKPLRQPKGTVYKVTR